MHFDLLPRIGRSTIGLMIIQLFIASQLSASETANIDWTAVHQRIDGFGASSAFDTVNQSDVDNQQENPINDRINAGNTKRVSLVDFLFDPAKGLGLSLLRTSIGTDLYYQDMASGTVPRQFYFMKKAHNKGVKVWTSSWTPPGNLKTNQSLKNGGSLKHEAYQAYAQQLADYAFRAQDVGISLEALSIQNEPNVNVDHETCVWTADQFKEFVPILFDQLRTRFPKNSAPKIMLAEHGQLNFNLASATMNDADVAAKVGILASHGYQITDTSGVKPVASNGKPVWLTEVCDMSNGPVTNPNSWERSLYWAGRIHDHLVREQVSAFHFWWINSKDSAGSEGLLNNWNPTKRAYVMGQFSRFIRPDYYRIDVNPSTLNNSVKISSFKDPVSKKIVIVAVNQGNSDVSQTFKINNSPLSYELSPWITDQSRNMVALVNLRPAKTGSTSSFTYSIPKMSMVTFVGAAISPVDEKPTLSLGSERTIFIPSNAQIASADVNAICIDGSAGSGSQLSYEWKADGQNKSQVSFASGKNSLNPSVRFAGTGVYLLVLTAKKTIGSQDFVESNTLKVKVLATPIAPILTTNWWRISAATKHYVNDGRTIQIRPHEAISLQAIIGDPAVPNFIDVNGVPVIPEFRWMSVEAYDSKHSPIKMTEILKTVQNPTILSFPSIGTYTVRCTYVRPISGSQNEDKSYSVIAVSEDLHFSVTASGGSTGPVVDPQNLRIAEAPRAEVPVGQNTQQKLSVLGADPGGSESNLTYTWTVNDKPLNALNPTFTPNSTNAAKNCTVAFTKAGVYQFQVTISDSRNSKRKIISDQLTVVVDQVANKVTIDQNREHMNEGGRKLFTAQLEDQFGDHQASIPTNFTWSVDEGPSAGTFSGGTFSSNVSADGVKNITVRYSASSTSLEPIIAHSTVIVDNLPPLVRDVSASPEFRRWIKLSSIATDGDGEENLNYQWTKLSGPALQFPDDNGKNTAKILWLSVDKPGTYEFSLRVSDLEGGSTQIAHSVFVTVETILTSVTISEAQHIPGLQVNRAKYYIATPLDQCGNVITTGIAKEWSVTRVNLPNNVGSPQVSRSEFGDGIFKTDTPGTYRLNVNCTLESMSKSGELDITVPAVDISAGPNSNG